jgi:2-polyprenyl-6-methoxyphenol hydroxylase-like FAD-dependent oxidoreductase
MTTVRNALIVGGGIGGLSAGVALRNAGIAVDLVELSPRFNVYGVGIIQPSNALRALDTLGLADECLRRGSPYGKVKLGTASGHVFTELGTPPLGRLPVHNGISRRILHDVLYEGAQARGVRFRLGLTVSELENSDAGVTVTFTDGSTTRYDLLVGADGLKSHVRKLVFGEYTPRYTGQSVWRYAFDRPAELETGYLFMGRHTKAGLIPMTDRTMYLFLVTAEGPDNPFIPEAELVPRFRERLAEYTAPMVRAVVERITDPKGVVYRPLETLLVTAPWHRGSVVLLGDAVHATIPQLGQGAGLAIEDAVVLGEELAGGQPLPVVFDRYMARRFDRCKLVVDVSATVGEWEQLDWQGRLPEGANIGALMGKTLAALGAPI